MAIGTEHLDRPLPKRDPGLDYPDDFRSMWQPRKPEFAAVCNALSLTMPYGEPYVIASVRTYLDEIEDPVLRARTEEYLSQEREHSRQHRRFNQLLVAQHPGLRRVEVWLARCKRWMTRRRSREFNVAFAAGFEAVAFAAARWIDRHRRTLLTGADETPARLFLWHLAEEVEHKSVAHDVWEAVDGNRWRYARAMTMSLLLLAWFIFIGTLVQLTRTRRIFNPLAWLRLIGWAFSFVFEVVPTMALTAAPGHHPNDLSDPVWLSTWLHDDEPTTNGIAGWKAQTTPSTATAPRSDAAPTKSTADVTVGIP